MKVRLKVSVAACLLATACAGGEGAKDTAARAAAPAAVGDERADAMSGAASSPEAPRGTATNGRPTVLVVGTSLTAGLGLDPDSAYPAVLQRMADSAGYAVRVVNAGLSGETSAGALRRLEWLLRQPAAVVMIETGANDGLRGLDVDSTRANLTAIVREVKRALPAAAVLLVQMEAPPNLGDDYTRRFRENYPLVARREGAALVPFLLAGVAGDRRLNQADGIHPTEAGARVVARNVWPTLEPYLARLAK
ncbi:MAG TPA: arylesterase [Gemmatimonadaceae bacterium]|nr:arylesterase [Gemmatimonadaceae bacterium]